MMRRWLEHWLLALTTGIVGALLTLGVFQAASEWDFRQREHDFQTDVQLHIDAIQAKLDRITILLESLGRFFASSEVVSAAEFANFARFSREQDPGLMALEWLPRVTDRERAAFEQGVRREGLADFAIKDLVDDHLRPAGRRDWYFPVLRAEPLTGNVSRLGFDPAANALLAPYLLHAIESGQATAAPVLTSPESLSDPLEVEILVPQYRSAKTDARSGSGTPAPLGIAVGRVQIKHLVDAVMSAIQHEDVVLMIRARSADRNPIVLHRPRADGLGDEGDLLLQTGLRVADRTFEVIAIPVAGTFDGSGWPISVLVVGCTLSLILSVLMQSIWMARNRLLDREARLRLFIEHAPASLAIFDREMRYLAVSQRWLRDYGQVGENLIGRSHYEACPEIPERWRQIHQRGLAGEVIRSEDDAFDRLDGSRQWVRWEVRPWRDAHGEIAGICIFTEEVTARKEAEQELSRFRQIVETSSEKLLFVDRETRVRVVNPAYASFYNATPDQLQGHLLADLLNADLYEEVKPYLMAALAGNIQRFQTHHRYPDGRSRWIEAEHRPYWLDAKVEGVVISLHDITEAQEARAALERHQAHLEEMVAGRTAELKAAESQMRLILDSSGDGIFGTDRQGRVMFVNPSACRMLGYRAEQLMGREMHALIHHSRPDGQPYPVEDCPSMTAARESRIVRVDNEVFWGASGGAIHVTYTAHPMVREGVVTGVVVNFIDMTLQKAAERAREAALVEAERLAQVRSEFLANMSHEIRTPLNGVLGLARIGQRQSDGRKIRETFELILDSGQHLLGVVDDILDFSKIEAGKLLLDIQRIELGLVFDRAISLVSGRAYAKGLDFRVDESPDLPRFCEGDALRLSQVLVNLLSNAIKFTEHGRVHLTIEREKAWLLMHVVDTGIGLSDEELSRLFTPFEQADGSTTRRFGGSGLGLSISLSLVELMGGDIEVESRQGEGSRFTVRLPLVAPDEPDPMPASRIGLMGLPPDESERFAKALRDWGVEAVVLEEGVHPHGLDLVLVCLTKIEPASLSALVGTGARVVVCNRRGDRMEFGAQPVALLEAPLRVRHLLRLLRREDAAVSAVIQAVARLQGCSVLAAEDNAVNRVVLAQLLEGEGARLTCFEDGMALLEHLQHEGDASYQILLMDIQMPRLDGYQTAKRCRERYPGLPVVGLTAHAMAEERRRCFEAGMVEHLPKPLDIDLLVEVIRRYARPLPDAAQPSAVESGARPESSDTTADVPLTETRVKASAVSPESESDIPLFDLEALEERYRGTPGFVRHLAAVLHRSQSDCPERLRMAASTSDWQQLAVEAHGVKGMSGNLMAEGLRRLAASTEKAARAESPEAADLAERLAQGVEELLSLLQP